jgi:DNA-binding NarL/FixJ family response regulator
VEDIEVVGGAADGQEAVELAAQTTPDVILMDLSMPGMDGIEATRKIVAARADVQIVVLTSMTDRERILGALDAGAVGYMLKDAEPEELIGGIRVAARGESPLAPKAARALLTARAESEQAELSEREREVLGWVAKGMPNKLIARELGISEKTVKAHLTRVFQQIGVTDRTQAALWAKQHLV